jgi:hypothetical protein
VLGEEKTEIEGTGAEDEKPKFWNSWHMQPNCKPFYVYEVMVSDYRQASENERDPDWNGDPRYGGPFRIDSGGPFQYDLDRLEMMPPPGNLV